MVAAAADAAASGVDGADAAETAAAGAACALVATVPSILLSDRRIRHLESHALVAWETHRQLDFHA